MKAVLLLAPLLLVGCSRMLDEPRQYYWNQEWQQLKELMTPPQQWQLQSNLSVLQQQASVNACTKASPNSRQTAQFGVSDHVAYQQCLVTPHAIGQTASGQRLQGRP